MEAPVVVVGGGLAGIAAAARLAKAGREVVLYERRPALGGSWAAYAHDGVLVDEAPAILGFPAPWRDLFRKSGRSLEAELARTGHALVPSLPATYRFADGAELSLPTERGAAYAALDHAYGTAVATAWRELLDRLDDVWQALRPLGVEAELDGRASLPRPVRARLRAGSTLASLAAELPHPHLVALVRSVAYRQGSRPEQTPAWVAVELAVQRTFGRWQVQAEPEQEGTGRSSVLTDALIGRLALRGVAVRLGREVSQLLGDGDRVLGVRTAEGPQDASAVVCTVNPWLLPGLLPAGPLRRRVTRRTRRLRPAAGPEIRNTLLDRSRPDVSELVTLTAEGRPVVRYERPVGARVLRSEHDFLAARADPAYGVAWRGFRSWTHRLPVRGLAPGLFTAGPGSAAGPGSSQQLLSGALAAYGCHEPLRPV